MKSLIYLKAKTASIRNYIPKTNGLSHSGKLLSKNREDTQDTGVEHFVAF